MDAATSALPEEIRCDVVIVGTGAGGGISAEILADNGLSVVMVEEGPLKSSSDFEGREADAYPQLYQESAARKTKDKAINILQGRCVGGSTTVNWTSSFRTPASTLAHWRDLYGLNTFDSDTLAPWFQAAERRLSVSVWTVPANENNDLLRRGAGRLGIPAAAILRNVKNCFNLGYCGMGCPTNAKQSMLVTTIPTALDRGATLLTRTRARRLVYDGRNPRRAIGIEVEGLDAAGLRPSGRIARILARHVVLAGGAINTPALLLRSKAPDPHGLAGKRTFLHPSAVCAAVFDERVDGFDGAPQTIYSDHFLTDPVTGPIGYKLEVPPIHPLLFATTLPGFGAEHAARMSRFRHTHALIALLRDGFHPDSPGGRVELRDDGSPVLDYPLNEFLFDGIRRSLLSMAEIQFAAGAREVIVVHETAGGFTDWPSARRALQTMPLEPLATRVVSAHVMGGATMAVDDRRGIVGPDGRHFHLDNVSVHDGSLFPTSLGVNPQLTIYAITARMAAGLVGELNGRPARPWGSA